MNNQKNKLVDLNADLGDVGQLRGQDFTVQSGQTHRKASAKDDGKSPFGKILRQYKSPKAAPRGKK
jgi:hypothetical protein